MGLGAIAAPDFSGTVDVLPLNAQLGAQIYLRRCGTCHLALPPETMPAEAWQVLIQDTTHCEQQKPSGDRQGKVIGVKE